MDPLLYLVVLGVTDWAFLVWSSNSSNIEKEKHRISIKITTFTISTVGKLQINQLNIKELA